MFKNILLGLLVAASVLATAPQANAGLLFRAPAVVIVGLCTVWVHPQIGILLIVLDAEGTLRQVPAELALQSKFPFLADQPEATRELTQAMVAQVTQAVTTNSAKTSVSEDTVRQILESTELSENQIQAVVQSLK